MENDGGPAFPQHEWSREGMSLRDWFAGMALMGLYVANDDVTGAGADNPLEAVARIAYAQADAMLAERAKG